MKRTYGMRYWMTVLALLSALWASPASLTADRRVTGSAQTYGPTPCFGRESAADLRQTADTTTLRDTLRGTGTARPGRLAPTAGQERQPDFAGPKRRRLQHRLGAEFRPEYIFPTNPFLDGVNSLMRPMDLSLAAHLKYSFQFRPGSYADRIYGGVYQGIGAAYYDFANPLELGNPVAIYLFQGARIARLSRRLSLNYEWNFGLSFGWKPYDRENNALNTMMGSRLNALLNVSFYLRWMLTHELDLTFGPTLTHFSNGNTTIPNAGLNSAGLQAGLRLFYLLFI